MYFTGASLWVSPQADAKAKIWGWLSGVSRQWSQVQESKRKALRKAITLWGSWRAACWGPRDTVSYHFGCPTGGTKELGHSSTNVQPFSLSWGGCSSSQPPAHLAQEHRGWDG